jgi:translin
MTDQLDLICEQIRREFDQKTALRDAALKQARELTRHASLAIRAIHREDHSEAQSEIDQARELAQALKEYCEACLTVAMIKGEALPTPQELEAEPPAYLNGLTETLGELRRRCLDLLRPGYSAEVERLLVMMDDVFTQLLTMDYPDAITDGLRRRTDLARGIIERTRADITVSFRQNELESKLDRLSGLLEGKQA